MSLYERRRPPLSFELVRTTGLLWLLLSAIYIATSWTAIVHLAPSDPDDMLRMVEVRDLLAGQAWWDLHQYRIDPPNGTLMHWSRLVDVPLWLGQLMLRPLLGAGLAEKITMVAVPLITLLSAMLLAARLAWRLIGDELVAYTALILVLATPVTAQMQPLRIDHHGWQIVAVLAALNGLTARSSRRGGWIAGLALALGMTVSLELLPFAALLGAVLVVRAIADPHERAVPAAYLQSLALVSGAAYLITHGFADLAAHCDTLLLPYLGGIAAAALGATVLAHAGPLPRPLVALCYLACAVLGGATLLAFAPQCSRGPFAALDPLVRSFWYDNVIEGMPIWHQTPARAAQMGLVPLAGLVGAIRLWQRSGGWLRGFWGEYAVLLAGLTVIGMLVARSSGMACAAGAVPLAWQVRGWLRSARECRRPLRRTLGLLGIAGIVMPGVPVLAAERLVFASPGSERTNSTGPGCDIAGAGPALARLEPATLFAPIDIGPALIAGSRHAVVASGHHRAARPMRDVIAGFIAAPEVARGIITAHGARYVVICPGLIEVQNYANAAHSGLMAQLAAGTLPTWLKAVTLPGNTGLHVWEVRATLAERAADEPASQPQAGRNASAAPFMQ